MAMQNQALDVWKTLHFRGVAPPTTCEACGLVLPTHSNAINMSFTAFVGVPGHPSLSPFQCPCSQEQSTEHWACSIECWRKIAHKCIDECMIPILQEGLTRVHGDLSHTKDGYS